MSMSGDERAAWIRAEVEQRRRAQRLILGVCGVFCVLAIAAVVVLVVDEATHAQRVAAGTPAVARVEALQEGFCWVGVRHATCMDITLAVAPSARAAFTTVVTHSVADRWMARVQPGQWLSVVIAKDDPQVVLIDDAAFERPPPPPAAL